ncbi:MAG: rhomboid family intramembrane serine protease [Gemmobacter sp.]
MSGQSARAGALAMLWFLSALILLPEALLIGADLGLWGSPSWRPLAYQWGGFWAGLWHGWQPNYPAQPVAMLLLYPQLHAGPWHMLGNLAGLWVVGGAIRRRCGGAGLALLWVAGAVAGGVVFGLLSRSAAPMVGASGAVFSLVGAWAWFDAQTCPPGLRRWGRLAGLGFIGIVVNVAMGVLTAGGIAWQTHLGGALAGVALASIVFANGRPLAGPPDLGKK